MTLDQVIQLNKQAKASIEQGFPEKALKALKDSQKLQQAFLSTNKIKAETYSLLGIYYKQV